MYIKFKQGAEKVKRILQEILKGIGRVRKNKAEEGTKND